jgi:hypothetical protein
MKHFLLTRFNPPTSYARQGEGLEPDWLEHRFNIFESFCLPSVLGQSNKSFSWLILFDMKTPKKWIDRIKGDIKCLPDAHILMTDRYCESVVTAGILKLIDINDTRHILTTRLDNDDAIACDYLGNALAVAKTLNHRQTHIIDHDNGCQVSRNGIFLIKFPLNPFLSVISPVDNLKTAFHTMHGRMDRIGKVTRVDSKGPHWMQVVHGKNISNRIDREATRTDIASLSRFVLRNGWFSQL